MPLEVRPPSTEAKRPSARYLDQGQLWVRIAEPGPDNRRMPLETQTPRQLLSQRCIASSFSSAVECPNWVARQVPRVWSSCGFTPKICWQRNTQAPSTHKSPEVRKVCEMASGSGNIEIRKCGRWTYRNLAGGGGAKSQLESWGCGSGRRGSSLVGVQLNFETFGQR